MSMIADTLGGRSIYAPAPTDFAYLDSNRIDRRYARARAAAARLGIGALRVAGLALVAFLIFVSTSFLGGFLAGLVGGLAKSAQWAIAPQTLLLTFQFGLYAPLALATFLRPRGVRPDRWRAAIGWTTAKIDLRLIGQVVGIQLLCLIWVVAVTVLTSQHGAPGTPNVLPVSQILAMVVLAPVVEEMFCRGWLQARAARLLPAWGAVVFTAVLFALAHYNGSFVKPLAVLALGLGTGWLRQRTGSLIPGMLLHALNNGVVVAMLLHG